MCHALRGARADWPGIRCCRPITVLLRQPGARNQITTSAEEGLFHYAPFKNESCPTWTEAESRFIYGAWNVYRVDAGNPHFGSGTSVEQAPAQVPVLPVTPHHRRCDRAVVIAPL